jgi:hypothetical protein
LHGEKDLWEAYQDDLVTSREAAEAIVAHVHSWLVEQTGTSWLDAAWDDASKVIDEIERMLVETRMAQATR